VIFIKDFFLTVILKYDNKSVGGKPIVGQPKSKKEEQVMRHIRKMLTASSEEEGRLTADLRRGDESCFWGLLQQGGVQVDDVLRVKEHDGDNEMLEGILEVFRHHCLFIPPHEQWRFYERLNEAVWQDPCLSKEAVWNKAGGPVWGDESPPGQRIKLPQVPMIHESGIYCATLVFDFADPRKTLDYYLRACEHVFADAFKLSSEHFVVEDKIADDAKFVFASGREPKATDPDQPRFRWLVTELGRSSRGGECLVKPTNGVGLELLLIAAMHPRWAVSLGQDITPWPAAASVTIDGQYMILGRANATCGNNLRLILKDDRGDHTRLPSDRVGWVTEVTQN